MTVTEGVRRALQPGRDRSAVPVRAALAGTILPVLAMTAAFTFGTNLLALVHTPRLYGQTWDAAVDVQFSFMSPAQARHWFGTNPGITAWTFEATTGCSASTATWCPRSAWSAARDRCCPRSCWPGTPRGAGRHRARHLNHAPSRAAHRPAGPRDRLRDPMRDRVVGRAVFPNFGQGGYTPTDLGEGAETTAAVLRPATLAYGGASGFEFVLLRFADGPGRKAAVTRFRRSMTGFCSHIQQSTCVVIGQRPNGLTNYAPR